jgi:TolB protein
VLCCGVFPTNFHWSTDSCQLVFPAFDGESLHLARVDIEREQPFDVGQLPPSVTQLYPSPDGSRYVMALSMEGQTDIFVINADGSGLTNLTHHPANDESPVWSPDGRYIAFVSNRGEMPELRRLYVMEVDGSNVRLVSDKCIGALSWRPTSIKGGGK